MHKAYLDTGMLCRSQCGVSSIKQITGRLLSLAVSTEGWAEQAAEELGLAGEEGEGYRRETSSPLRLLMAITCLDLTALTESQYDTARIGQQSLDVEDVNINARYPSSKLIALTLCFYGPNPQPTVYSVLPLLPWLAFVGSCASVVVISHRMCCERLRAYQLIFLLAHCSPFQIILFVAFLVPKHIPHIPIDFATLMSRVPTRYCPVFALFILFMYFDCAFRLCSRMCSRYSAHSVCRPLYVVVIRVCCGRERSPIAF